MDQRRTEANSLVEGLKRLEKIREWENDNTRTTKINKKG